MQVSTQTSTTTISKSLRVIVSLLMLMVLSFGSNVSWGQTNPAAFALSGGNFSFTSQTASSTTYPTNIQGWNNGGTNNLATLSTAASTTDYSLTASATGSTIGIGNLGTNGFQFLSSGTTTGTPPPAQVGALAVSLNATGRQSLLVSWTAAQQTLSTGRITNLTLQYRLGTSGTFTTVSSSTFTTTGSATAASGGTFSNIALPSACDNQSVVQIRWLYYESAAQSGSRQAIRLDDITVSSTAQSALTPPTITAASGASVDAAFSATFTDDATWRAAITGVTVGGTALTAGYAVSSGQITFTPSASIPAGLLQSIGTKTIVVTATGYSTSSFSQTISAGAANKLAMNTQPAAPASNGGALATQPKVNIVDQYGNATASTASVSAAVGAGTWTLGGTTSVAAIGGTTTFAGLTATSAAAVSNATIAFSSTGLTGITSGTFNIPAPAPANDLCANAVVLSVNSGTINATLAGATNSNTFSVSANKNDVWYKFTPTVTGSHTLTVSFATGPDLDIYIFTGATCPTSGAATFSAATTNATSEVYTGSFTAGTTYTVRITDFNTNAGAFTIGLTGPANPVITGAATATAFTTTYGTASAAQTFSVSGTGLSTSLTATAPTGFEVSSDGTSYAATATFAQTSGNASGSLRIRLKANAAVSGTYNSVNIVLSSTGATSQNITTASSGNSVSPAALTITASNQSKVYNTSLALGTSAFTSTGLQNSETIGSVTLSDGGAASTTTTTVGTYPITPSAATGGTFAAGNYTITYTDGTLNITKANQTITFATLANKFDNDAPFNLTGTASSGLTVTYTSSAPSVASVSGNTLTPVAPGSTDITASQAGDANWNAATDVVRTQTILSGAAANQTITFSTLSNKTYGDAPFTLNGSASSGLTVTYVSSNPAIASISGNQVTILKAGTVNITASQAGNGSYNPAPDVTRSLTIDPKGLTITGATAQNKTYNASTAVTITGGSLAGVVGTDAVGFTGGGTFASANAGTGIIVNTTYTLNGTDAANYSLTQPSLTADITPAALTVTADNRTKVYNTSLTLGTTAFTSTGLVGGQTIGSVTLSANGAASTTTTAVGTYPITASAATGGTFNSANYTITYADGTLTITKASQTITFTTIPAKTTGSAPFTLVATATSGLTVTFTSNTTSIVTVSGTTATMAGATGTGSITASQAGDANWNAASPTVTNTFTVTAAVLAAFNNTWSGTPATASATTLGTNVSSAVLARVGLTAASSSTRFSSSNWTSSNYLTITVTPTAGNSLNLNGQGITATMSSSGTGPSVYTLYSSVDNYTTALGTYACTGTSTITLPSSGYNNLCTVVFRIYGNATGCSSTFSSAGTGGVNSLSIAGTAATQAAPAITSSLTAGGTVGTAFSYTITGTNTPTTFAASGLPTGLSVNTNTGAITGTPTQAGSSNVSISATNCGGTSSVQTLVLTIAQGSQTITFNTPATKVYGDAPFTLNGTASSGLTVTYSSSNTSVATVSGNTVTILAAGTSTITASQAGDANYTAATSVDRTLTVDKANQTITFAALADKNDTDAPFILNGTASSGLTVSYTSSNPAVATISGNTVTITGAGTTTITASQAGDNNYNAASSLQQVQTVLSTFCSTLFTVTGGGAYCAGGSGSVVGLSGSVSGVNYQLKLGATNVGSPVAGTGSAISFGNQTTAGTYTVTASSEGCTAIMTGNAVVSVTTTAAPTGSTSQSFCNSSTVADLTATGTSVVWYDASSAGTQYSSSDALVNGNHYFGSQTLNGCPSSTRLDVTVTINNPAAPTGSASQNFCFTGTVADLTATGSNIKWYDAATGGTLLTATDALVNGSHYYASQTISACESATRFDVTVTITSPSAPTGSATQSFCHSGTVADLSASGTAIQWYDAATGGTLLSGTDVLVDGTHYYASQTINGCTSSRLDVTVSVNNPSAPIGSSSQSFCNSGTVADLSATGTGIQWFDAATGGTLLSGTDVLVDGTHYYASQTISSCASTTRLDVTVIINNPSAPTGTASQSFCYSGTVADLTATGSNIKWYDAATGGTLLTATDALVNGSHYYASQTISSCESSTRLDVTVTINNNPAVSAITGSSTVTINSTTQLSNSTPGGTWSSDNSSVASISSEGLVTGVAIGSTTINYAVTNTCGTTTVHHSITVVPVCNFTVAGSITGSLNACYGYGPSSANNTYSIATTDANGYVWTVSDTSKMVIVSGQNTSSIAVHFISPFTAGTISVKVSSSCGADITRTTDTIIRNAPESPVISGPVNACPYLGGTEAVYSIAPVDGAESYRWTIPAAMTLVSANTDSTTIHVTFNAGFANADLASRTLAVSAVSGCGNSADGFFVVVAAKPPAPTSIQFQAIQTNVCGARIYRYTAPLLPITTDYTIEATGYSWAFTGVLGANATLDSGTLSSRVIIVRYTSNAAGIEGDSVKVLFTSDCGNSPEKAYKIPNAVIGAPKAPLSLTIQAIQTNVCSAKIYRYTAPELTDAGANTMPATGYNWVFTGTLGANATLDSGTLSSKVIVVRFTSNAAANLADSVKVAFTSDCGTGDYRGNKLTNTALNTPLAPTAITQTLIANNCGARVYRYTMPVYPAGNTLTGGANGYLWILGDGPVGSTGSLDSGTVNSRVIRVIYTSNAAALAGDSIRAAYTSECGLGKAKAAKLINALLSEPAAPTAITQTLISNNCGARVYRYTAPALPVATATVGAGTGYAWTLPVGPVGSTGTLDSGSVSSRVIRIMYTSNAAASAGDSIKIAFNSDCGLGKVKAVKLSNAILGVPLAPTAITQILVVNNCGARVYRYTAPALPAATATVGAATGYSWTLPTGPLGSTGTLDSGSVNSRVIRVIYTSNAAAAAGDSIRVAYTSDCGLGKLKATKLSNAALGVPTAPAAITQTLVVNDCGARVYRYTAPALPVGTATTGAATGYVWTLPEGPVGSTGMLDSGTVNSRVIRVIYTSNSASVAGDSIRLAYNSGCGMSKVKAFKLTILAKTGCVARPPAKTSEPLITKVVTDLKPVISKIEAQVYPNPSTTNFKLQVKTTAKEQIRVRIVDAMGRSFKQATMMPGEVLNFGVELKTGTYIIEIMQGSQRTTQQIIKL